MLFGLAALTVPPFPVERSRAAEPARVNAVGGILVDRPYSFAAVLIKNGNANCSATLVASQWALTAAHCVTGAAPYELRLRIGGIDVDRGEVRSVLSVVPEPHNVDIALLGLDGSATSAALPLGQRPRAGTTIRSLGFGRNCGAANTAPPAAPNSAAPAGPTCPHNRGQLMQVDTPLSPDSVCAGIDGTYNSTSELCLGSTAAPSVCFGDAGGPAVVETDTGPELVGVTSGGTADSCAEGLDMYVDVTAFSTWIFAVSNERPSGSG
jgi:secreted trypsin-like serine protease